MSKKIISNFFWFGTPCGYGSPLLISLISPGSSKQDPTKPFLDGSPTCLVEVALPPGYRCWEFTTSTPLLVKTDHFKRSCIKYCWHPIFINSMYVKLKTQPYVYSHCIATSNPRMSMTMPRTMSDALLRRITCREIWSALGVDSENNPPIIQLRLEKELFAAFVRYYIFLAWDVDETGKFKIFTNPGGRIFANLQDPAMSTLLYHFSLSVLRFNIGIIKAWRSNGPFPSLALWPLLIRILICVWLESKRVVIWHKDCVSDSCSFIILFVSINHYCVLTYKGLNIRVNLNLKNMNMELLVLI